MNLKLTKEQYNFIRGLIWDEIDKLIGDPSDWKPDEVHILCELSDMVGPCDSKIGYIYASPKKTLREQILDMDSRFTSENFKIINKLYREVKKQLKTIAKPLSKT